MDTILSFERFVQRDVAAGQASDSTIRTYISHARRYQIWCEEQSIDVLTADVNVIRDYRSQLTDSYARSSIASHLSVLRRFYDMIVDRGLRSDNPVARVKSPRQPSDPSDTRHWFSLPEIRDLLGTQNGDSEKSLRDRAIIELMIFHGPRVAEVAGLDVDDYTKNQIEVEGKGGRRRRLLLIPRTKQAIDAWLNVRPGVAAPDEDALFVSFSPIYRGSRLSVRGVRYVVDLHLIAAGIKRPGASCHSLRHSFATLSRAAGARLDAIGKAMGHSDLKTTQIYADIVDKEQHNPARHIDAALHCR